MSDTMNAMALAEDLSDQLTDEQRAAQEAAEAARQSRLDAFAGALSKKRKQAVEARAQSGIEQEWLQDEEFYEGIDDANRDEVEAPLKPSNQRGQASVVQLGQKKTGSTLFLNITRAYVDFSAGRAADMLLPTDEPAWSIGPTPMPDVLAVMSDASPEFGGKIIDPVKQTTLAQAAKQMVEEARQKADKAQKRIQDWHEEGQVRAEMRKQLKDAAKVGVGILKGPFPQKRVSRAVIKDDAGKYTMKLAKETKPNSKRVDYWNFYPDPACGENIHNGSFVWESDDITARQLRDLKGTQDSDGNPMYIESAIDMILEEGPQRRFENDRNYLAPDTESFQIWYYHGIATREDMAAAGVTDVAAGDVIPVIVTMINERVIKAERSTLDSGDFPYDVMPWQPRAGHWTGIGVARQVRTPQRMVNAANRNMMDNAGMAAGPQIIIRDGDVRPADNSGVLKIAPRTIWKLNKDSDCKDVREAMAAIPFPIMQNELLAIIQFALKMAEDVTGMPMLMQGQQGQASDTVGGMQILTNNSNTPMRAIAKQYDDYVTNPHIRRYYEWLLMYSPDNDEKGDMQITAHGSSALFERDAQNQAIMAMAPFVKDPDFKIDPAKWMKEWLQAQRLTPARFQYSDAEWQEVQDRMAQNPPSDPRLEAAKIGAEARVKTAEISADVMKERIAKDTDRDAIYAETQAKRDANDHEKTLTELQTRRELAMLDYANREKISLDQVKERLATTAMKVQAQKELSAMALGSDLHKHHNPSPNVLTPPTEPAGKAPPGEAFQA